MAEAATTITFEASVQAIGDRLNARLPSAASEALPSRGQVAIEGTINGQPVDTVVEPDGMRGHWLAFDDSLRRSLSLEDGTAVSVELRRAETWPEPDVPDDLRAALEDAPDLSDTWTDITPMARWEWVRWVNSTANPKTRARRVEVSISKLRDGKRRPCCFDLSSCTDPELSKSGKLNA